MKPSLRLLSLAVFMIIAYGQIKRRTILDKIASRHGVSPYSHVTYAAMIGSIDPVRGDLIPGVVWQTRRKPLLLDEFRTGGVCGTSGAGIEI